MKRLQFNSKTLLNRDLPAEPQMTMTTADETAQRPSADAESRSLRRNRKRFQMEQRTKAILSQAAGVRNADLALLFATQMGAMQPVFAGGRVQSLVHATGLLQEMVPQNAMEAMRAMQTYGVHNVIVKFLKLASRPDQTVEDCDASVARVTRLMRLVNEQIDTLANVKGKTRQQKVTVEHAARALRGPAVVGALEAKKREEANSTE